MSNEGLRFGPLDGSAVHVAVDMQRLFGEETEWHCVPLASIVDKVGAVAEHAPSRTVFTRFRTPLAIEDSSGQWRRYYARWEGVLAGAMHPDMFDLMPPLRGFLAAAHVADKTTYSGFGSEAFLLRLRELQPSTLIFTGVETDVCVIATLLGAVDRGYRCVLVHDAVASSSETGHNAVLAIARERFSEQIEVVDTASLLREWGRHV